MCFFTDLSKFCCLLFLCRKDGTTTVKVTILDGIVSVNSLFTIAVFLGLTFSSAQQTLVTNTHCQADSYITKQLVLFEVISFSFFLFSSIVAQGLKMAIVVLNGKDTRQSSSAVINLNLLYFGMCSSGFGSVVGSAFLIASIVHVIQIRLGVLGCHDQYSLGAVVTLLVMVPLGLLVYIHIAMYAIVKKVE